VLAVDLDSVKIKCARRNAEIYGVAERITFICGNFFHVARALLGSRPPNTGSHIDAVFLSPPWGGPTYLQQLVFDLQRDMCPDGDSIMHWASQLTPNICIFLPRNTSIKQLAEMAERYGVVVEGSHGKEEVKLEVEQNLLNKKLKTITAYLGYLLGQ